MKELFNAINALVDAKVDLEIQKLKNDLAQNYRHNLFTVERNIIKGVESNLTEVLNNLDQRLRSIEGKEQVD
jgi:hypothetical protein